MKELTHLGKHGYGVVVGCKDELELKEALLHQQPVMVFIHDEEAQQLNSAMKQRCCAFDQQQQPTPYISMYLNLTCNNVYVRKTERPFPNMARVTLHMYTRVCVTCLLCFIRF